MKKEFAGLDLGAGLLGVAGTASAAVVTLSLSSTPDPYSYQVSQQTPCIIGDHSPNDPTKGGCSPPKNNITGGDLPATAMYASSGGAFQIFENNVGDPTTAAQYTVSQFADFPVFSVAIDENSNVQTTAETDRLFYFRVYIGGSLAYEFYNEAGAVISSINNGTGWSDYLLSTIDLTGYDPTTSVVFDAKWQSGDGNDYFFIVPEGYPVPEPGTLALLGLGLAGLGLSRRGKRT